MSILQIEAAKTTIIDGVEYKAEINKKVNIDFSVATYTIKIWEDVHDAEIEFIPDNMDFLKEVTDIFPLSEYSTRIVQSLCRHIKPHVSLYLDIQNKSTGEKIYFADSVTLSDTDYDYVLNILVKEVPKYEWRTAEEYIRCGMKQYLRETISGDLFTDDAIELLSQMVSERWEDIKTDGHVDFESDSVIHVARDIIEEALRKLCEIRGLS